MDGKPVVHGTRPDRLVEKIVRERIFDSQYWKEHCFGITAEGLAEKGIELSCVGGTYAGNNKPTDFLCLTLKMLQLQPSKEIVEEFILNEDFRYLRALGCFYLRLVGNGLEIYNLLEPLYRDYSRLRRRRPNGSYEWTHMDEFVDALLNEDFVCNITLPFLARRSAFEETGQLSPRKSALDEVARAAREREMIGGEGDDSEAKGDDSEAKGDPVTIHRDDTAGDA